MSQQKKMAALRLAKVMQDLHDTAHDRSLPEDEGAQAATELATTVLRHFDLIVWGMRKAGGARNP